MGRTKEGSVTREVQWVLMKDENDLYHDHDNNSELVDSEEFTDSSVESSSSSDLVDDASSSSTSSSSYGPLYELSELMAQLPIKRGLSIYYQGQSQSFASLASVKSLEDLAKKGDFISYNKRMKPNKSFGDSKKFGPRPTIAKRSFMAKRESTKVVGSFDRSCVQKQSTCSYPLLDPKFLALGT